MSRKNWRGWFLGAVTVGGIAAAFWFSPIPQDPTYHEFADRRTFFGIPNFWNVFSNLSFVLVGAFGLRMVSRLQPSSPRSAYVVFCTRGGVVSASVRPITTILPQRRRWFGIGYL